MRQSPTRRRKASKEEIAEWLAALRRDLPPGSTVHTILKHVSRSGMYRAIDVRHLHDSEADWLSFRVAAVCGMRFDERWEAVGAGGCGMDMGFHVVSTLSRVLYPDGFGCIGENCPSNDHANGDRDYTPHVEARQRRCPAHPETKPSGDKACGKCLKDGGPERPLTVLWNRNSRHAFYVCDDCREAMLEQAWIEDAMPECRTCHGNGGVLPAGHWHRSGDYALRHRWL